MKYNKLLLIAAILSTTIFFSTNAQIDVKQKTKDKTINRADQRTDEGIDKGLDAVEDGVKSVFKKKDKPKDNDEVTNEPDNKTEEETKTANSDEKSVNKQEQPVLTSYSKYDFIPGDKVVFYDDFSQDAVGDFPALWNTNGSGEVITTNLFPGKWFKTTGTGYYFPETKNAFTENFTVEFDVIPQSTEDNDYTNIGFYICDGDLKNPLEGGAIPGKAGIKIFFENSQCSYNAYADGNYTMEGSNEKVGIQKNKKYRISVWVQKQRIRVYVNENKAIDAPRALSQGFNYNMLRFEQDAAYSATITNFRVAAGAPDMRSKLITEGKLVTYGIYFDVNSDKVKPESYGTLKSIAAVLTENSDVKVKIIGHTDADGDAAKNLDLSKRRAISVKNELSKNFAIDASRIETDGKGKTEPIAPNDTPANKAQNRRVEFIKL